MNSELLLVQASCNGKMECLFENRDLTLDIAVKNISPYTIGLPLQYIQAKGPYLTLIDNATQTKVVLKTGLPKFGLKNVLTTVKPGDVVHLSSVLKARELTEFRSRRTDISVRIELSTQVDIGSASQPPTHDLRNFEASTTLRILSQESP
ncbi:hypothetical protein SAMN05192549_104351 [Duganella sacchari]|uniref:Uncharacterized protein n=1 Tax=Duganella sacchari TaxID=551987 RepID=A0A1M7P2T1_9BURK|nr:hypothetical protein [Duganella sacchari]SHN10770.1 hypothetical protein SAMN05192549_104351 [Duganella sacchari]